jgi:hypothetical protein
VSIPVSLIGNSAKLFSGKRDTFGGGVFYAIRVLCKETSPLFVPELLVLRQRTVLIEPGTFECYASTVIMAPVDDGNFPT